MINDCKERWKLEVNVNMSSKMKMFYDNTELESANLAVLKTQLQY